MKPYTPCNCPGCSKKRQHALIKVLDQDGQEWPVRVPWQHRYDPIGWGDREHIQWGDGQRGLEVARGEAGITVVAPDGARHRLNHGDFRVHKGRPLAKGVQIIRLVKSQALKAGQHWITLKTNGEHVLIQEEKDGTHRIISGAGGKLTHLRLYKVKPPADKETKRAAAKARRDQRRKEQALQSPETRQTQKDITEKAKARKTAAERKFIEAVREHAGGVSEDLDDSKLEGLSEKATDKLWNQHHRKQLREAMDRKNELAQAAATEELKRGKEEAAASLFGTPEPDPVVKLVEADLKATAEDKGKKAIPSGVATASQKALREKIEAKAVEAIEAAPDPAKALEKLGGRDDAPDAPILKPTTEASKEAERRGLQLTQDAKVLHEAATGGTMKDEAAQKVVARVLEKAGVEAGTPEAEDALKAEAVKRIRAAQKQAALGKRLADVENEPNGKERAYNLLAQADLKRNVNAEAKDAIAQGLADTAHVPVEAPEEASMMELLKSADEMRKAQRGYKATKKAAEKGDFDRSRRAFDLEVSADSEPTAGLEEDIRRQVTEQLLGMASPTKTEHQQAISAGHYDAMADVGLSIAGQRYIDRPTMDALGPKNAAVVMRWAMEADGHDPADVLQSLEAFHVEQVVKASNEALAKADAYIPGLTQKVADIGDIEAAGKALDAHEADIADVQRVIGSAIGHLEATATMGQVFREKATDTMAVPLGNRSPELTASYLRGAGLRDGDFKIDREKGEITIPQSSWSRLIQKAPAEDIALRAKANAIKAGQMDEPGWLPPGISRREASTFTAPLPEAPNLRESLDLSKGIKEGLSDHVGSRLASGEDPRDIMSDLLAPVNVGAASDPDKYVAEVENLFPVTKDGRTVKFGELQDHFNGVAKAFMEKRHGTEIGAFHAQDIDPSNPATHEAIFRTLAEHPEGVVAFKPTGQLTPQDQRAIRDAFYKRQGIDPKVQADTAAFNAAWAAIGPEPEGAQAQAGLFGGFTASGEHADWTRKRDAILSQYPREGMEEAIKALGANPDPAKVEAIKTRAAEAPTAWGSYVEAHSSLELAQRAMQDEMKSNFLQRFQTEHGKLTGKTLNTGVVEVTNAERHKRAVGTEEEIAKMRAEESGMMAGLRERVGGQFASEGEGAVKAKYTRFLDQEAIDRQNQLSMFGGTPAAKVEVKKRSPGLAERLTVGERAENQIASLVNGDIGRQFEPGKPVGLFAGLNMDGSRVHQQRVLKQFDATHRMGAFLGTGSGKSLVSIGAFTQAHAKGETKHGLYLVPSAVQRQFGSEMLRYTEPGKYTWGTGEGKSHEQRVAMLKDPNVQMRVMTHQSFRDTALKVMADHHGRTTEQMRSDLTRVDPETRARWMKEAFDANGIPQHLVYYDEAHGATARDDNPSLTHLVATAVTHPMNATHAMLGTATPTKNDAGEMWSWASILDPVRYGDRTNFLASFGQQFEHNPHAIRRELSHLTYTARIDPEGVDRVDTDNPRIEHGSPLFGTPDRKVAHGGPLPLLPAHQKLVDEIQGHYERAQEAANRGEVDEAAVRGLLPAASLKGLNDEQVKAKLKRALPALGVIRQAALRRAVGRAPAEINTKLQAMTPVIQHDLATNWTDRKGNERKGKASVVFTDSAQEAKLIHEHLQKQGIRAAFFHGGLSDDEKNNIRLGFQPEDKKTPPAYDVVVGTSSMEAGLNMQRASVIHHYDVPLTEKSHAQRVGRAYRQGQLGDVDVHNWSTRTGYEEGGVRALRGKTGMATVFQTPLGNLDETGIGFHHHQTMAHKQQAAEPMAA